MIVFLVKVEANSTFSEVGRLQLYVAMRIPKDPPKPKEGVSFDPLTEILLYLRNYSNKEQFLSTL